MKVILILTSLIVLVTACKKVDLNKLSDTPWNPQLGAPLLNAEFSVEDIIAKMDSNGNVGFLNKVVTLSYSTTLDTLSINNLITTNPIKDKKQIEFPDIVNEIIETNVGPENLGTAFKLDFGENKISKVEFKSGELVLKIGTEIPHGFKFNIKIPSLQKDNQSFAKEMLMTYQSNNSNSIELRIPLEGYTLELDPVNNDFQVDFTTTLIGSGKTSTSSLLSVGINLLNYGISYAEGTFGEFSKKLQNSVEINLLKNAASTTFGLTNPRVKFSVENSFGFPISILIDSITSQEKNKTIDIILTNKTLINSNGITNRYQTSSMDKILISKSSINEAGYNNLQADSIDQLINSREKTLKYFISTNVNQDNTKALITDKSYLIIKATAELPLEAYATNLEINETLDFKLDNGDMKYDYVEIKLLAINKFPLDVEGSLILLDENKDTIPNAQGNKIDLLDIKSKNKPNSLTRVFNAAKIDNNGNITPSNKSLSIEITKENINYLKRARFIKITGKLNAGSSTEPIKITESNSLKLMLGIKTSVKPTLK